MGTLRVKIFPGSTKRRLVVRAPISRRSEHPLRSGVVEPKRVVERHGREIDNRCAQTRRLDCLVDRVEQIGLDGDEDHLDLPVGAASDLLVIPDHLVDRKRNVLLRLEEDNPLDFFRADWRQRHEAGKNRLLGHGVVDSSALDLQLVQHLAQRRGNLRVSRSFLGRIDQKFTRPVAAQDQPATRLDAKLGQLDALRAEIERDDACPGGHSPDKNSIIRPPNASLMDRKSRKYDDKCPPLTDT